MLGDELDEGLLTVPRPICRRPGREPLEELDHHVVHLKGSPAIGTGQAGDLVQAGTCQQPGAILKR
jgi:hypothetical protein